MKLAEGAAARPRAMGYWPDAALVVGGVFIVVNAALLVIAWPDGDLPWAVGQTIMLAISAVVRRKRPDLSVSCWVAFSAPLAIVGELTNTTLTALLDTERSADAVALVAAAGLFAGALGAVVVTHLLIAYPGDLRAVGWERWVVRFVWALLAVPVIVVFGASEIPIPFYIDDGGGIDNPFRVLPIALSPSTVEAIGSASPIVLLGGVAVLVAHYRRAGPGIRGQMRWLLVPFPLIAFGVVLNLVLASSGQALVWLVWLVLQPAVPLAGAIGILQPEGWSADRVLRRALVYGLLWLGIIGALVATAAIAGTTAERYVPVGWAILVAVVVSLAFQPVRRRLEAAAARWVFGEPVDHSAVIAELGETLAVTFDLEHLLPRMAGALEDGLQVGWAHVRLEGADERNGRVAELTVPIELDGERLGVVECGEKLDGAWTDGDRAVVATFARQAALAVRNVRLTEEMARYAADLERSRARIARAAESERRRIERNIHDGVQQDLVVLIGMVGRLQREAGAGDVGEDLQQLRRRLERVLSDLRSLASGIYPSVLSDQGIVPAVEALVAAHPHPVQLRADPSLRDLRLGEAVEGAAYFTVAEALTNSLKHACAEQIGVTLGRTNGSLTVEVTDDGVGFDPVEQISGSGLQGLSDRVGALGGSFRVDSDQESGGTRVQARLDITNGSPS